MCFVDSLKGMFISEDGFRKALYMIDIGQNDIAHSFNKGNSYSQTVKLIPQIVAEIKTAIKVRYFGLIELSYAQCNLLKLVFWYAEVV